MNEYTILIWTFLFSGLRTLLHKYLCKEYHRKKDLFCSIVVSTFHAFIVSSCTLGELRTQKYDEYELQIYPFSVGYFIYDTLFICRDIIKRRRITQNDIIYLMHHIFGIIAILVRSSYPEFILQSVAMCIGMTELAVIPLNIQWWIETYYRKKENERAYTNLFRFNLVCYFIFRIIISYYSVILSFYYNNLCSAAMCFPFVLFNTLWCRRLWRKYKTLSMCFGA